MGSCLNTLQEHGLAWMSEMLTWKKVADVISIDIHLKSGSLIRIVKLKKVMITYASVHGAKAVRFFEDGGRRSNGEGQFGCRGELIIPLTDSSRDLCLSMCT